MPMRTFELPAHLNAFIDEQAQLGCQASPDDVVVAALERYAQDVATELELADQLDAGDFASTAVRAFMMQVRHSRAALLRPVTPELRDCIEKLIGPISEIEVDIDIKVQGESEL